MAGIQPLTESNAKSVPYVITAVSKTHRAEIMFFQFHRHSHPRPPLTSSEKGGNSRIRKQQAGDLRGVKSGVKFPSQSNTHRRRGDKNGVGMKNDLGSKMELAKCCLARISSRNRSNLHSEIRTNPTNFLSIGQRCIAIFVIYQSTSKMKKVDVLVLKTDLVTRKWDF